MHVESVLRYGLPINYVAAIVKPKLKYEKKVKDSLVSAFAHLGGAGGVDQVIEETETVFFFFLKKNQKKNVRLQLDDTPTGQEYYPFVFFQLNLDLIK